MLALALAAPLAPWDAARAQASAKLPLVGSARLTVFGFQVYDARLWAARGLTPQNYATRELALELAYLRSFKGADIAARSLKEMRRIEPLDEAQAQRWQAAMAAIFPDVSEGDRLQGAYRPGEGVRFFFNDRPLGEIADPAFGRVFIGIWLSPKTPEPKMRDELLGGTP